MERKAMKKMFKTRIINAFSFEKNIDKAQFHYTYCPHTMQNCFLYTNINIYRIYNLTII